MLQKQNDVCPKWRQRFSHSNKDWHFSVDENVTEEISILYDKLLDRMHSNDSDSKQTFS